LSIIMRSMRSLSMIAMVSIVAPPMVRIFIHRLRNEEIAGMMRVPISFWTANAGARMGPGRISAAVCASVLVPIL
jgi:hypothetical protein